jgi:hypothetical protein
MAVTFYGVNKTLQNTGVVNTIDPELQGGKVKCLIDEYTFTTSEVATDIIELGGMILPLGARIVDWVIDHGDLANNRTLSFGNSAAAAALMAATDCGAAADKKNMTDDGVAATLGYEIDAATKQIPTLTLGGGAAAAVKVIVAIFYVCKG